MFPNYFSKRQEMKGETVGHHRQLHCGFKWSSATIKYSQLFPQFRIPSFPTGRAVLRVFANVEIHCLNTIYTVL